MMPSRRAHYPAATDVDEVLRALEADDERQKEALRKFYARNAAPHYSKPLKFNWWGFFIAGAIAGLGVWWVITQVIDGLMGAFGQ